MRKILVSIAILAPVLAIGFTQGACSSSASIDCKAKACANDPAPTDAAVAQCQKLNDACSGKCADYFSCANTNRANVCGADGKTDPAKAQSVGLQCLSKITQDCATCVQQNSSGS